MDYTTASLVDTADAIAAGRTRVRDVVEGCLDRYRRIGGTLACFVDIDEAGAIDAADRDDRFLHESKPTGPLFGVPLAHKDLYYRQGRVSACGSRLREDFRPANTATVLERLDAAGGIEIGRLAMVEFAMGPHGFNANYDHCRNPWNTDYIPCGSSSGSGVAVGARLVHASLGSDTGGLDPVSGRRFRRRRSGADTWPGQPLRCHADVAVAGHRRSARPHGTRLRACIRCHRRPRPEGCRYFPPVLGRGGSVPSTGRPLATHRRRARILRRRSASASGRRTQRSAGRSS